MTPPDEKKVICSHAGFSLVKVGKDTHVWDEVDGSMSSPLHETMIFAFIKHPESLLDIQMIGPSTKKCGAEELEILIEAGSQAN